MAKRGRKSNTERKGYFYETEEEAFVNYLRCEDEHEKNKIFNTYLYPALSKMVESIIRRYRLYLPDEEFKETFDDTMSFMMSKISNFNPDSGYKAYSYCGTICKHYLILKVTQFRKNQERNESYEDHAVALENHVQFSYDDHSSKIAFLGEIMLETSENVQHMIDNKMKYKLNENEIKVGLGLINLLTNWEDLFAQMGSNKFNKSSILLFLKETTLLNAKEIRDGMKKYKILYYNIKKKMIETIY